MVARIATVAFQGFEVLDVDVQVQMSPGLPAFTIVGLPDKAVGESRERVRAALTAIGLSLPSERITVNLSPADVLKEGSHFDLPIAIGLLAAMGVLPADEIATYTALGELALDGGLTSVAGVLPAAIHASASSRGLICPAAQGSEAAFAGDIEILAAQNLLSLINHFKGSQTLAAPEPLVAEAAMALPDMADIKGQETAKRALEVAAAGGHNMLMVGPPGAGKSMLAARLPGLLPPLDPSEALSVSMIQSLAGQLEGGRITRVRPFRDPHHGASLAALTGGVLEALRQPLEAGQITVARANAHVTYSARVQLIAAMNPCRCGYLDDPVQACSRVPRCAQDYQAKISGPLFDRIDLHVDVPAVNPADLSAPAPAESSANILKRVTAARDIQRHRYAALSHETPIRTSIRTNAEADGKLLEQIATPDEAGKQLLHDAAARMKLTARGYHRVLKVARTLADLESTEQISRLHIAEALSYRRIVPGRDPVTAGIN